MILYTLPLILLIFHPTTSSPPFLPQTPDFEPHQQIIPLSRLPRAIFPSHYTVELQPILDQGHGVRFTCPGKVWINFSCLFGSTNITLHALGLNITHETVQVYEFPTLTPVSISSFSEDTEKEQFIINTGELLRPGGVYRLYIEFTAPVSNQLLVGLYLSNYTSDNGETRYLATTDLEATDARRVFPCFDEPDLKATFDISILRLPHYHSLSNMDLLSTEDVPTLPGWLKDTFHRTEYMSTYLICIAVSDFEMEEASPGLYRKPVRVWGPPPYMRIGAGSYSPDITAKLLTALEDYYQVNYTFPKMDKIAIPHFSSGAMENWGLNTYRLNRLLIEEGVATVADRVSAASTLSHELVHQWFGNLVTMWWWDDLWLNEGFASYYSNTAMQDIGLDDMLPLDTLVSDAVQRAMQYDATNATHPIHYAVQTPTEIRILFDTITYSKGAALVRMMNAILTEPVMRSGLTSYLKKHDHQNAHQDDLFNTLDQEASSHPTPLLPENITLKEIMDDWTLQSGFPVLRITRTPGSPSIIFQQYKYRDDSSLPDDGTKWTIPISVTTSSDSNVDTSVKLWLLKTDPLKFYASDVDLKWVVVNPQQTGYYRVSYNEASLKEIIEQLHQDHTVFDPQTRSALVDDNLNLAFAGYFQLEHALNLTMYLKNERHLVPWTSFLNNMGRPNRMLGRGVIGGYFKAYVLGLVKDTLGQIGLDPQDGEAVGNGTILRNKLFEWACNFGDSECVGYSVGKFREWMGDPGNNSIIFPDLRPFVYCTAVANGGAAEWDFVLDQYKEQGHREATRLNLLRSLGCSRSAYRLSLLLDLAIDLGSGIDESHRLTAIQAAVGNTAGVDITLDFVRNRVSTINRRFGPSFVAGVITALGNNLNKEYDIGDLERFVGDNEADLGSVKGTIDNAINAVHGNVRWVQRNGGQFDRFLRGLA